jgi:hypothetical protein
MELTVEQIQADASQRQHFAEKLADLQKMADILYPGSKVQIVTTTSTKLEERFACGGFNKVEPQSKRHLTSGDHIAEILLDHTDPLTADDIINILQHEGRIMSPQTLFTYLSKNAKGQFTRVSRGLWTHTDHVEKRNPSLR